MTAQFIPLVDLNAQYQSLKDELRAAAINVMDRGDFILGEDVNLFEEEFAKYLSVKHAIGCGSGTDALVLALRTLEIGLGDEVIVPAMTFIASALAVSLTGASPVLVDVDPDTALIDLDKVEGAITNKTKAIMPVHLYGQCVDMTALRVLADKHQLYIVEDAAQSHGAMDKNGIMAGSAGDLGCFSFYPGKNLGAYGDAGMVVCNDGSKANKLKLFRNWGSVRKYHHEEVGYNSRLDTMQAAILRVKLPHLHDWTQSRRKLAKLYDNELSSHKDITVTKSTGTPVYHLYVIRVKNRDKLLNALNAAGIGAGIHYPFALHQLKAYHHLGHKIGDFPEAEAWAGSCLSLPIYAELPSSVISLVSEVIEHNL